MDYHRCNSLPIKVIIDQEECIMCGNCEDLCPEVFVLGEDDIAQVVEEYQTEDGAHGAIPEEHEECAQSGADACPVAIIHLT